MRTSMTSQSQFVRYLISQKQARWESSFAFTAFPRIFLAVVALFCASMLFAAPPMAAQTQATPHAAPPAHKATHPQAHRGKPHPGVSKTAAALAKEAPKPPEAPKWPANDHAVPASVIWDSQGLRIDASNSSLMQILKDVQTATGAEVQGMATDQRVFGAYGPGLARDVLSQLLQGSGYNVLMIGDLGKGAPRQIVLSARDAGSAKGAGDKGAAGSGDDDTAEAEPEEQPQQQPVAQPVQPGFGPGGLPRSPQQIMQEMQQRQQQLNQQQGQPPPPQPPPN
jgi:hypothetical protein